MDGQVEEIKDPAAVLAALERAKQDAKTHREAHEALKAQFDELNAEVEQLRSVKPDEKLRARVIELEVANALAKAGADTERASKYVKAGELDLDDDGKVTGLSERIEEVKKDLPELFDKKRRVGGGADLFTSGTPNVDESPTRKQVARIFS
jgi:multidrug resistance efflux pump